MMACDSPDHLHHHLCQELVVGCGYTRVIATRVGALGSSFVRAAKPGDFTWAKREKPPCDANSYIPRLPRGKLREFTLEELGKATANFSGERVIGRGGFGKVFKGILSDGKVIAVKVQKECSGQGGLKQFQAEMRASCAIMGIYHHNLVPAIGYHSSRKRKMAKVMIVYPFMANRDVSSCLGDRRTSSFTPLDWTTRKRIALQVARGICSLHQLGIVHRDIKLSNVMLNENFDAFVGDFGIAKSIGLPRNSYDVAGLHGYLSGVSCYNAVKPGDAGSGVSNAESTSLANSRFLGNDTWTEIVEVDQNERGNSKQLSLQANQETFHFCADSDIPSHWIRFSSVRTRGSSSGDDDDDKEEVCSALEFDINEEVPGDDGNQSRRTYDFSQEEWKIEHLAGSTGSTNSRSLENDAWAVFEEVDQNEGRNPKQLTSQANRHEVTTKLRKVLDRMREMESDHHAAMEEMHQKQIAIMQSMIKMQGKYIQKVNEMQSQMDELKGTSQKALADESNHLGISFRTVQLKLVLFCLDISFRIIFVFCIVSILVRGLGHVNNLKIKM